MSYPLLFAVLCFATHRVWRFIALDALPPLVAVRDRATDVAARRHGNDWADGLECVWCSGFWATCAVVGTTWALHPLPLPGLWFLAVSTVVGLLGSRLED